MRHRPATFVGVVAVALTIATATVAQSPSQSVLDQQLLRQRLIDVGQNIGDADAALKAFDANRRSIHFPTWLISTPQHTVDGGYYTLHVHIDARQFTLSGNTSSGSLHSAATVAGDTYAVQLTNNPPGQIDPFQLGVPNFGIRIDFVVPGCKFDFVIAETCYPSATLNNPADSGLFVTLTQGDGFTVNVGLGKSTRFDRSLGNTTISIAEVKANSFSPLKLSLSAHEGPSIAPPSDFAHDDRFAVYTTLSDIVSAIRVKEADTANPYQSLDLKTLHAEARILSAYAIQARFPQHVRELLKSRADDLAKADASVLALRKLIIASSAWSPQDVNVTLARIDQLIADPTIANKDTLTVMRQELVRASDAASSTGDAISLVKDNLLSGVDAQIADYQALVLEYAQLPSTRTARR